MDNDNYVVRGQLLQDFIDMAESLPRRFMIGLTLAREAEVQLYVCVPGCIYVVSLGTMPCSYIAQKNACNAEPTDSEQIVVQFLLFLHQQLAKDSGYLTGRGIGFPCNFMLGDIVGSSPNERSILRPTTNIRLGYASIATNEVLGRHAYLRGQRTWVYPAQYSDEESGEYRDVFFKFQWAIDSDLEIDVHQFILDKGVPHVPRLLYAASMVGKGASGPCRQRFKGEVMVMEDVGMSIASAFDANGLNKSDAEIIDLFAGYTHALFAAATVEDDKFALHRDVSMGNLMVGPSGKPYIIDWGFFLKSPF
ncbi:hypothetical protein LPJ56_004764 [Coemansia sp. RSA 2599]|nr:hypothetical protein LPJ56_004764 [Coemansia sp. RSA 2599]